MSSDLSTCDAASVFIASASASPCASPSPSSCVSSPASASPASPASSLTAKAEATEGWAIIPDPKSSPLKYNVHSVFQGMSNDKVKTLSRSLNMPLAVLLFNLDGSMNIAMSIRTAAVLGCSDVYIVGKKKYDARGAVGAKHYINIHRFPEVDPKTFFTENKLIPILVEQGGTDLESFKFNPFLKAADDGWTPVIIMGSEGHGLPREWLTMDLGPIVSISQMGLMRSLNVSIACSIIIYEYARQWRSHVASRLL